MKNAAVSTVRVMFFRRKVATVAAPRFCSQPPVTSANVSPGCRSMAAGVYLAIKLLRVVGPTQ